MTILYIGSSIVIAVITLVFTLLKISGTITWDWVWVLSPLWSALAFEFAALVYAILHIFSQKKSPPKRAVG